MHLVAIPRKTNHHRRFGLILLALTAQITAGCSQPAQPRQPSPEQPRAAAVKKVELPEATLPDNFVVKLELAVTQQEVADGLMYRPSLPEDRGMLFIFDADRYPSFWMKNTLISLDLVFLDAAGSVVDVVANVPPCAADPCPTYSPRSPARAVLEVAAGTASAHGIEPGVAILFERVPGYPVDQPDAAEAPLNS